MTFREFVRDPKNLETLALDEGPLVALKNYGGWEHGMDWPDWQPVMVTAWSHRAPVYPQEIYRPLFPDQEWG